MKNQTPEETDYELDDLNVDIENYLANTIIPQLYVDCNLILRKITIPAINQFNLTPDDINQNIQEVSEKINFPALLKHIKQVINTGNNLEKEIQTSDNRWFQMNILPYMIRNENKSNGVMITLIDITKRIEVITELEKVNAEQSTLLYKLSHNLKQPISNIGLLADELTEAFNKKDTDQFTVWIEILRSASGKMNKIIRDFTNQL
jgi:two-component system phosphate regulon sensor histidine kinase PhoR